MHTAAKSGKNVLLFEFFSGHLKRPIPSGDGHVRTVEGLFLTCFFKDSEMGLFIFITIEMCSLTSRVHFN